LAEKAKALAFALKRAFAQKKWNFNLVSLTFLFPTFSFNYAKTVFAHICFL
jgi:hypothetical protein